MNDKLKKPLQKTGLSMGSKVKGGIMMQLYFVVLKKHPPQGVVLRGVFYYLPACCSAVELLLVCLFSILEKTSALL
jgi:hypothetical protein